MTRRLASLVLFAALGASPASAACPSAADDVLAQANGALAAYAAMDAVVYTKARDEALAALACVRDVISPIDAATLHRLMGLDAYLAQQRARGVGAFRAALAIQPAFRLSSSVAPEGHPLLEWYEAGREAGEGDARPLLAPSGATIYVDGARATAVRPGQAAVLQLVSLDGAVRETAYVAADGELPWWASAAPAAAAEPVPAPVAAAPAPLPAAPEPLPSAPPPAETPRPRGKGGPVFLGVAGGAAVASGVLYGVAWSARGAYDDPATPYRDLDGLRARVNGLTVASGASAALALGLGVTGIVTLAW